MEACHALIQSERVPAVLRESNRLERSVFAVTLRTEISATLMNATADRVNTTC